MVDESSLTCPQNIQRLEGATAAIEVQQSDSPGCAVDSDLVKSGHSLEGNGNEEMAQGKGLMEYKMVGGCP